MRVILHRTHGPLSDSRPCNLDDLLDEHDGLREQEPLVRAMLDTVGTFVGGGGATPTFAIMKVHGGVQ